MTTWAVRQAEPWPGPGSRSWLPGCAQVTLGQSCVSMPPASLAMAGTGMHLLELCGLVEARVIDLDGVYNPCRPNDGLLLGMKGSISEFELGILRTRMYTRPPAAKRGGANCASPYRSATSGIARLVWATTRIRARARAVRQIFSRFRQLGSARQVHLAAQAGARAFSAPVGRAEAGHVRLDANPATAT